MKKIIPMIIALALFLTACGGGEPLTNGEGGIDIDLTVMTDTMVYSQVYDLMTNPTDYLEKTMKFVGTFYSEVDAATLTKYNFIIINDATGCCPQGLEFILDDEEDEYPDEMQSIEMVGTVVPYEVAGNTYYRILATEVSEIDSIEYNK